MGKKFTVNTLILEKVALSWFSSQDKLGNVSDDSLLGHRWQCNEPFLQPDLAYHRRLSVHREGGLRRVPGAYAPCLDTRRI